MLRNRILKSIVVGCALAVSACSSGGGTDPGGSITLTLSAGTLNIIQGALQSLTATIGRSGDFDGAVTITVENLPANVTAAANPTSIPSGSTTSQITFTVGAGATPATTTVTVRASGTGVTARTATFQLTITSSSASGYTISLSPASLSIQQGQQSQTTATLARTGGFAGNVQFSATAPSGITVTFSPTGTTGNTTTATVAVGAGVAAQAHQVTIRGTATGLADVTAVLPVTVTTSGGGGGSTTFRVCNQTMLFAAFQDGNGPWTAATITGGNTITFNMGARGAVAYVFGTAGGGFSTIVMYGTQAELNSGAGACVQPPAGKTVNGSVANVPVDQLASIALGTSFASVIPAVATNFTLMQVPDVTTDLIAARFNWDLAAVKQTANKIIVRRSQDPDNNATLPVLDFNAEGVVPVTRNLTVQNLGADMLGLSVTFGSNNLTQASTALAILSDPLGSAVSVRPYPAHPTPGATDIHAFSMFTVPVGGSTRALVAYYKDGIDRTVTLGPALGAVTVTAAATAPSARLRVQYTTQTDYNRGWATNFSQTGGATNRFYNLNVTPGYQGASTTFDYTMPDLSGLAGWNATWGLVAGQQVNWALTGTGGDLTAFLDGSIARTASRSGTITP
jgi:hypothetical protein